MFGLAVRRPVYLTAICLALLVTGCGGAESRKAKHMAKGEEFLAAGNLEKARVEFRNALQIVPTDSDARYENGVVDERLANYREAGQFYTGALESNPDNVRARTSLARLYLLSGAPDKAMETVTPGFAKNPNDPGLLTVRAAAKIQLKDPEGALADAQRAVQIAPTSEDAVAVLAGIYKSAGETDKAETLLQDAIKRTPSSVDLRLVLAQLEAALGKKPEVEALLIELVHLRPTEKAHRLRLAQFYAGTDQTDAAERTLRDALKAIPEDRDVKTALIDFLAARRGRDAAEKELAVLIAASPQDYELKFVQAGFYEQGKDYAKAEAVYKDVIAAAKYEGPGIAARDRLAALRVQLNDVTGAEALLGEVLTHSPRDNDALIMRGNLALAQKDPRTAIADLRSVLRDQPNAVGVMRSLARAHLANGEPALAEETMRRASEINPKDPAIRLDLAELLAQIGKPDQAKPVVEELIKDQPNNVRALDVEFKVSAAVKDWAAAKTAADAMVALQPKSGLGYFYLGQLAEAQGKSDDALRSYATAMDLQPDTTQPLQASTRLLVNLKRIPEALKRLDDVSARFPTSAFAPNLKGEVLMSSGRNADSISAFRLAIERDPKWWLPYRNLALAQIGDHKEDDGVVTLQQGIDKASTPDGLQIELASFYERKGKIDQATAVYEDGLRKNPKSDVAANNLAMLLVTYKKDAKSLDRAKELATRFSSSPNPGFLDTYGWVLYKRGEAAAAVAALEDATAKAPNQPTPLYHLGMAQVLAGQPDLARESLERSLRTGENFSGMDEAKSTLDHLAREAPAGITAPKS